MNDARASGLTPYYDQDGVTIFHGDCREILPLMEPASVDLVLTDPPYGVNKAAWDQEFPSDWIEHAWRVSPRMLVMPGNTALMIAGQTLGQYKDCVVLYSKNGMTLSKIAFGNWIPVIACGNWKWEARPNVLPFIVNASESIDHPSPKPLAAIQLLIEKYTKPGWLILDPFGGSGTTARAAKDLGRRCILIEREERYCAIAVERLRQSVLPLEAR